MRIAILGAGNVGSALARAFVRLGHSVVLSAKHPDHAMKVAADVGAEAAGTNVEAVRSAELVVLAVPSTAIASILEDAANDMVGKVVVDSTNPVNVDYMEMLSANGSVTEGIVAFEPELTVVKAFNTILASRLIDPIVDGIPLDGFYAGDDEAAKATVAELLAAMGFRPMDAGVLLAARALERMAFLNISFNLRNGWSWQSGWKLLGPTG